MFSGASQKEWRETFDFTTRISGFLMVSNHRFDLFSTRIFWTLLVNVKYPPTVSKATHREKKRTVPFGPLRWDPVTVQSLHGEHLN